MEAERKKEMRRRGGGLESRGSPEEGLWAGETGIGVVPAQGKPSLELEENFLTESKRDWSGVPGQWEGEGKGIFLVEGRVLKGGRELEDAAKEGTKAVE